MEESAGQLNTKNATAFSIRIKEIKRGDEEKANVGEALRSPVQGRLGDTAYLGEEGTTPVLRHLTRCPTDKGKGREIKALRRVLPEKHAGEGGIL